MLLMPYNYFQVAVGSFNGWIILYLNAVQIFRLVNFEANRKKGDPSVSRDLVLKIRLGVSQEAVEITC